MNPILIEEKSINAWPSLKTVLYKGCNIRFAGTYSNRANSANPLYTDKNDYGDVITYAESLYTANKQLCCFKIIDTSSYMVLDSLLEKKQYEKIHETSILTCPLTNSDAQTDNTIFISSSFTDDWISSMCALQVMTDTDAHTCRSILKSIQVETIVCSIISDSEFLGCGYATIENGWAGFYDIIIKKELRGQGLGKKVMKSLMAEAFKKKCTTGYLQVMKNNTPASHLYEKLGFMFAYSYWYRKKQALP